MRIGIVFILYPLSKKAVVTQMRMSEIAPELSAIKEKYKDSAEEQEFYAGMGMPVKVAGYKQVPRKADTIILLGKNMATGYNFRIYGDRGGNLRGQDSNAKTVPQSRTNNDLFHDFLVNIVGWTIPASNGAVPVPPPPPVGA